MATIYRRVLALPPLECCNQLAGLNGATLNLFTPSPPTPVRPLPEDPAILFPPALTIWDQVVINQGDLTLAEFLDLFPRLHHGAVPTALWSYLDQSKPLYSNFGARVNLDQRLSSLYMEKYGLLDDNQTWFVLEGTFEVEGQNALAPLIKFFFR
eukprot:TRINITY_DN11817_c0_g1_i1.p2 TRINITY_DN11817_c0_g1~~TRINITY_DN11817_c0_g1_i1.p2  ORF type:complete len:154 (-),score=41.39 TRINITY_DN11817_c0_g1_i1:146-607(-)